MHEPLVVYEVTDGIGRITLNRPDKRNALNAEMVDEVRRALELASDDATVRVVLVRGAGKDFCSGADLAELERIAEMGTEESVADAMRLGELFIAMRRHPRPIVAAVQGRALAGGCGLATACDLVLAREDAQLGYPEVHLGFVPAMVMAILRRKVGESRAFELVSRGDRITASRAEEVGLVTRVFGVADFEVGVEAYAAELARRPASALELSKRLLYALGDLDFEAGIELGAEVNAEARQSPECREGVRRFLEKGR
jgi:methylglutaconyl-CoA hydratase